MTSILCRVLGHRYRYYVIQESTQPQADVYRSAAAAAPAPNDTRP